MLRNKFEYSQYWFDDVWKSKMAGGGGNKKRFQYCSDPSGQEILYLRAPQGHSGRNPIDPSLQDNVLIPNNFFEYIYHIGCAVNLHSSTNSGLVAGGQNSSRDRQTVFFTAVNPMHKNHKDPQELDLTKPRLASYEKRHQDTVYWVDIQLAQRKGLKFYQTRSNAIIPHDTLPAYCTSKAIVMKSEEIISQKVYVSPWPPPKISNNGNWMCDLDSDVARSSKDIQRIEPKPNTQLSSTVRPVCGEKEEIKERTKFDRDTLNQEKHDDVIDSTTTVRPLCGAESTKRCLLTLTHVEEDQASTVRPILVDQKKEHEIDFRVPGLSHAVLKEAAHLQGHELVNRIENHPRREALHADLQQNNVYNPFSKKSKAMIWELGNVELSELCETILKVRCSHCLLYWHQGIVYCTCGQCLIESKSRRKFHKLRLDALSIPNYVIKKRPTHGARHGKTEVQREYHLVWNAWKRCCKKVDSQGEHFTGIHDRFLRYHLTPEEEKRYQGQWFLTLNKQGKNGPMKLRSDFRAAVLMKNRLHHESGEQVEERLHQDQQRRWHSSSSASWWDKSDCNWKWADNFF